MAHDHHTEELTDRARRARLYDALAERWGITPRRVRLTDLDDLEALEGASYPIGRWAHQGPRQPSSPTLDDVPPRVQLDPEAMADILASTAGALGWAPFTVRITNDRISLIVQKEDRS